MIGPEAKMVFITTSSSSSTSSTHETQLAAAKSPISDQRGEVVEMPVTLPLEPQLLLKHAHSAWPVRR